jgi:hypothetical protein
MDALQPLRAGLTLDRMRMVMKFKPPGIREGLEEARASARRADLGGLIL